VFRDKRAADYGSDATPLELSPKVFRTVATRYPIPVMAELLAASLIRDVPDFPKPGILFKDITPVLEDPAAFQEVIDLMSAKALESGAEVIVGIESRGFVFGTPIALQCKLPFAMTRKLGKLPYERITEEYALEYGTNTVEMHTDAIKPGQKAYIIDDLMATGGTAAAARRLVERLGGEVVGFGCMIELTFLDGREALPGVPVNALLEF
jgi:adenine phosphoribosyltransferase